jgi:hypothetical protein
MANMVMGMPVMASWVEKDKSTMCHEMSLPLVYKVNRVNISAVTHITADYTPLN